MQDMGGLSTRLITKTECRHALMASVGFEETKSNSHAVLRRFCPMGEASHAPGSSRISNSEEPDMYLESRVR
jgi:hypothetical protein